MNVSVLPGANTAPGRGGLVGHLAIDPDLEPGPAALDLDDEVDALERDRDVAGDGRGLALGAGRRDGDRPLAGGQLEDALNVPSSPTFTVSDAGVAGGTGVALSVALVPVAGPVYVALTTTESAFVVRPCTGIAPFSNVAPSAGWSTVSVGASIARNGTVMKMRMFSSECLPVSGSSALTSNWFRPRRRSTSAVHDAGRIGGHAVAGRGRAWRW